MFVACPQCGFLVAAQSGTTQRCPRCGSAIDPRKAKQVQPARAKKTAKQKDVAAEPTAESAVVETAEAIETPPVETAPAPVAAVQKRRHHAPSFVRRHAPALARSTSWRAWLVAAALAFVLLLQLVLAQRADLAADAKWRPLVSGLCGMVRCEVPPWREPAAFTMLQRSVQPKPGTPGVLRVGATFRNDARWPQPWPTVLLTLSDMDGRQVGARAFEPPQYRSGSGAERIAPGESATIQLDVIEPAQQVVAFTFDFR